MAYRSHESIDGLEKCARRIGNQYADETLMIGDGVRVVGQPSSVIRRYANPPPTPNAAFLHYEVPFSMGIRVGDLMVAGGTVAIDEDGNAVFPNDLRRQTGECMKYLERVVLDLGGSMNDVVSLSSFFGTLDGWKQAARLQASYCPGGTTANGIVAGTASYRGPVFWSPEFVVESELVAIAGANRRFADPTGLYPALGGARFHHGVRCGDLIYVAGQVALDESGRVLHEGDMAAQTRIVMENIHRVLKELGGTMADIVNMRTYYVGNEGWPEAIKARAEYLHDGPTNTSVRVASLLVPGLLIQIEVVAMVNTAKHYIDPPNHYAPTEPPFHHGVRSGPMIFVGAQAPLDAVGNLVHPNDIVGQTPIAMDNMLQMFASLGARADDMVQYRTYYVGRENVNDTIPIRSSYFKADFGPVSRGAMVEELTEPAIRIAFEGTAVLDDM